MTLDNNLSCLHFRSLDCYPHEYIPTEAKTLAVEERAEDAGDQTHRPRVSQVATWWLPYGELGSLEEALQHHSCCRYVS
eukprot:5142595-Amphidinium_carterae.1